MYVEFYNWLFLQQFTFFLFIFVSISLVWCERLFFRQMPVMDGISATERIRAAEQEGRLSRRNIIIALSSSPEHRERCFQVGMNGRNLIHFNSLSPFLFILFVVSQFVHIFSMFHFCWQIFWRNQSLPIHSFKLSIDSNLHNNLFLHLNQSLDLFEKLICTIFEHYIYDILFEIKFLVVHLLCVRACVCVCVLTYNSSKRATSLSTHNFMHQNVYGKVSLVQSKESKVKEIQYFHLISTTTTNNFVILFQKWTSDFIWRIKVEYNWKMNCTVENIWRWGIDENSWWDLWGVNSVTCVNVAKDVVTGLNLMDSFSKNQNFHKHQI